MVPDARIPVVCVAISLAIAISIMLGGTSDQLEFGNSRCLLFVENYHLVGTSWIFDANSLMCSAVVSFASIDLLLLAAVVLGYFLLVRNGSVPKLYLKYNIFFFLAWATISFVVAIVFTAGLGQTCKQFQTNSAGSSCGTIFANGFFENNVVGSGKNLMTANAAMGASYVVALGWIAVAGMMWNEWRTYSEKWWTSV